MDDNQSNQSVISGKTKDRIRRPRRKPKSCFCCPADYYHRVHIGAQHRLSYREVTTVAKSSSMTSSGVSELEAAGQATTSDLTFDKLRHLELCDLVCRGQTLDRRHMLGIAVAFVVGCTVSINGIDSLSCGRRGHPTWPRSQTPKRQRSNTSERRRKTNPNECRSIRT